MAFLLQFASIVGLACHVIVAHSPQSLNALQRRQLDQTRLLCSREIHCILAREAVEGPYYVDNPMIRSNITENRTGAFMNLTITLLNVQNCSPVPNAYVDIWHADAIGEYSGWASDQLTRRSPMSILSERGIPVESSRWLRGVLPSDKNGSARFSTVFPGWYPGRSTHIHLRVHIGNISDDSGHFIGSSNISHTGQLFFSDDLVTEMSKTQEPYATHRKALLPTLNGDDGIYLDSHGGDQIVSVAKNSDGFFTGTVTVGIDPTSNQRSATMGNSPELPTGSRTSGGHRMSIRQNRVWLILAFIDVFAFAVRSRML
jgi:protocatechuate 3,4-dioxygenase beta subunit